jgi:hypothetical protein
VAPVRAVESQSARTQTPILIPVPEPVPVEPAQLLRRQTPTPTVLPAVTLATGVLMEALMMEGAETACGLVVAYAAE